MIINMSYILHRACHHNYDILCALKQAKHLPLHKVADTPFHIQRCDLARKTNRYKYPMVEAYYIPQAQYLEPLFLQFKAYLLTIFFNSIQHLSNWESYPTNC